jgi:uncharacterized protein YqeY
MTSSVRQRMQEDLRAAMQARDQLAVSVLRSTLAAIANAESVDPATADRHATEVDRKHLTDEDIVAIVKAERDDLRVASTEMASLRQERKADELAQQAALLHSYLS